MSTSCTVLFRSELAIVGVIVRCIFTAAVIWHGPVFQSLSSVEVPPNCLQLPTSLSDCRQALFLANDQVLQARCSCLELARLDHWPETGRCSCLQNYICAGLAWLGRLAQIKKKLFLSPSVAESHMYRKMERS